MQQLCEGVILSKKGFGEGHLLLNFLDSKLGKLTLTAYGAALETGKKRSLLSTGSFIEGMITLNPKTQRYTLSDTKISLTIDNIRQDLKPIGFTFFTLEILDLLILEGDIFPYYADLISAFSLFDDSLDEKYVLFFLGKFLYKEGWLYISEMEKIQPQTKRFIMDAQIHPMTFLQGKNLSSPRKHELSYLYAHAIKKVRYIKPKSLELLRFYTDI